MLLSLIDPKEHIEKNGHSVLVEKTPLGHVDCDRPTACNDRVIMRSPLGNRERIIRDQFVWIEDQLGDRTGFLGRIVAGPFFSRKEALQVTSQLAPDVTQAGDLVVFA